MYAVVLVGGFGTRLRPLTNDVPKPMLPVLHRPMIVRLVERLAAGGVTDVVLALGFKPEPFRRRRSPTAGAATCACTTRSSRSRSTRPVRSPSQRAIGRASTSTFVVANGDVITDLDVSAAGRRPPRPAASAATIHLTPVDDPSAFGVVETDADGVVRRFVEKPAPGETDVQSDQRRHVRVRAVGARSDRAGRKVSIERDTFPLLVDRGALSAVATDDYWIDAGRPELYLQANLDLVSGRRGPPTSRQSPLDGDGRSVGDVLVDAVVGAGCVVGDGAS